VLQLSVGQYQAYREAARLAGIEVDTADTAIRKLVNSAGAAIESTGAQRTAFASLGVTANDLAGGPDAYIPKVAAALLAIGDKSVVAHDAVALFGKSGQEILPLLQQWAQGSGELTDKLKTMGLVMDDEVAAKAEEAEIRMSAAFDRLKVTAFRQRYCNHQCAHGDDRQSGLKRSAHDLEYPHPCGDRPAEIARWCAAFGAAINLARIPVRRRRPTF
jgi:hypothetical protein